MKKNILIASLVLVMISLSSIITYAETTDSKLISISLVNQDPDPAIAGDVLEIRLGVENSGGTSAENLILQVVEEYPFSMVSGESPIQEVGTIKAYQTGDDIKIVKFKIRIDRDVTAGSYELKIKEYEESTPGVSTTRSINIDIKSRESAEVIYIDKTILIPGKQSSMKFTINNVGNAPLRDMTFYWENEDKIILPVGSDNTKYVKYIDIGESAELEYQVIADTNADPGLYELDLFLSYDDPLTNEEKEINTIAGVYVGGETDFDVAFSESSAGETSFSIANIGSNPASSVAVIIPKQQGWKTSGSNSMIIGNLNKGDYTVATFKLQSSGTGFTPQEGMTREEMKAARQEMEDGNTIKIQIDYTDTMGERKTVEKEVTVNAISTSTDTESGTMPARFRGMKQQSFFSEYKWPIIGIILIVGGIFLYRRYKRLKITNSNLKIRHLYKISVLKQIFSLKKNRSI